LGLKNLLNKLGLILPLALLHKQKSWAQARPTSTPRDRVFIVRENTRLILPQDFAFKLSSGQRSTSAKDSIKLQMIIISRFHF
jgi:hypothetical protein